MAMSLTQHQLVETALALPQSDRADLAFHLLQSLHAPGEQVDAAEFGAELHDRLAAHKRGELASYSLDETREIVQRRLSEGQAQ
jgi:putative addiction module component (TIGR02574 family)